MQQYREVKQQHPGTLVLFRVGDFFELFESDAETACSVLGISMTSRDKGVPMAGFPHRALDEHARKLVQAGYSVVVCDQVSVQDDSPGLMRREVVRVLTPGTLTEDDLLDPRLPNHLSAVWLQGDQAGLAWVDLSTGAFHAADVEWSRLADELARLAPAECLHAESVSEQLRDLLSKAVPGMVLTARPAWVFDQPSARAALLHHFGASTATGFGFKDGQACVCSAGAVLLYLNETCKSSLAHLRRPRPYRPEGHCSTA
jgi:DNA mismatch repair protein MutS